MNKLPTRYVRSLFFDSDMVASVAPFTLFFSSTPNSIMITFIYFYVHFKNRTHVVEPLLAMQQYRIGLCVDGDLYMHPSTIIFACFHN